MGGFNPEDSMKIPVAVSRIEARRASSTLIYFCSTTPGYELFPDRLYDFEARLLAEDSRMKEE